MLTLIEMSWWFGGYVFYEYHKAFSARASAILLNQNIKIDWLIRDSNLFCSSLQVTRPVLLCNSLAM